MLVACDLLGGTRLYIHMNPQIWWNKIFGNGIPKSKIKMPGSKNDVLRGEKKERLFGLILDLWICMDHLRPIFKPKNIEVNPIISVLLGDNWRLLSLCVSDCKQLTKSMILVPWQNGYGSMTKARDGFLLCWKQSHQNDIILCLELLKYRIELNDLIWFITQVLSLEFNYKN